MLNESFVQPITGQGESLYGVTLWELDRLRREITGVVDFIVCYCRFGGDERLPYGRTEVDLRLHMTSNEILEYAEDLVNDDSLWRLSHLRPWEFRKSYVWQEGSEKPYWLSPCTEDCQQFLGFMLSMMRNNTHFTVQI